MLRQDARAAIRHDGTVKGGLIWEPEGADNYLAELAAQLDAAAAELPGGRIIIVMDATSPVKAIRRLSTLSLRRKQGKYAAQWLIDLHDLLSKQEVVVFFWQQSHKGSAINKWADIECDRKVEEEGASIVPVYRNADATVALKFSAPRRSNGEWADKLSSGLILRRLTSSLTTSLTHDEYDIPELSLPDSTQRTCDAVLSRRCQFGDVRKHIGRLRHLMLGAATCPFGCADHKGAPEQFTWDHVQFRCSNSDIQEARSTWATKLLKAINVLDEEGTPHTQAHEVHRRATVGLNGNNGGLSNSSSWNKHTEITARRLVGGLIRITADPRLNKSKRLRSVLTEATTAGAQVQQIALKSQESLKKNFWLRRLTLGKYISLQRTGSRSPERADRLAWPLCEDCTTATTE